LKTKAEIVRFIHDRGLVSCLGGNELPSFISAVLGKPWKPSAKGFKGWLDWWSLKISGERLQKVSGEMERSDDIVATRIFRNSKTFFSEKLWELIDPIVKHERELAEEQALSSLELRILETIRSAESIRTDRLKSVLNLEAREKTSTFHRCLVNLESRALIVGAEDPNPERHLHANIWQTWEHGTGAARRRSHLSYEESVAKLLEATLDACVLARDDQIRKWFKWSKATLSAREELVESGRVLVVGSYLVPSRVRQA